MTFIKTLIPTKRMKKIILTLFCAIAGLSGLMHADVIKPKSIIEINILGVPAKDQGNIRGTYAVNANGFIRIWPQKEIKASGLTGDALARKLESMYKSSQLFTNPTVQIMTNSSTDALAQDMITVGGDVRAPGPKPHSRDMTLFTAVMAAGGPTEFGKVSEVNLYRNGKRYVYNLKNAQHKLLKIYPNDTIEIPRKGLWDGFKN